MDSYRPLTVIEASCSIYRNIYLRSYHQTLHCINFHPLLSHWSNSTEAQPVGACSFTKSGMEINWVQSALSDCSIFSEIITNVFYIFVTHWSQLAHCSILTWPVWICLSSRCLRLQGSLADAAGGSSMGERRPPALHSY